MYSCLCYYISCHYIITVNTGYSIEDIDDCVSWMSSFVEVLGESSSLTVNTLVGGQKDDMMHIQRKSLTLKLLNDGIERFHNKAIIELQKHRDW